MKEAQAPAPKKKLQELGEVVRRFALVRDLDKPDPQPFAQDTGAARRAYRIVPAGRRNVSLAPMLRSRYDVSPTHTCLCHETL